MKRRKGKAKSRSEKPLITFNHDERKMNDVLGVEEKRYDQLADACSTAVANEKNRKRSEDIEQAVKLAKPSTPAEILMLGWMVGQAQNHLSSMGAMKKFAKVMAAVVAADD